MRAKALILYLLFIYPQVAAARNPFFEAAKKAEAVSQIEQQVQCEPQNSDKETVVVEKIVTKTSSEFDVNKYEFRGEVNDTLVLFNKEKQAIEYIQKSDLNKDGLGILIPAVGEYNEKDTEE